MKNLWVGGHGLKPTSMGADAERPSDAPCTRRFVVPQIHNGWIFCTIASHAVSASEGRSASAPIDVGFNPCFPNPCNLLKRKRAAAFAGAFAAALLAGAGTARAVIVFRGNGRNLSPPTGDLAQSGWQYEGLWNGFTGTVIGPHQFITATHVGGQVGGLFELAGTRYPAVGWTHVSDSDMTIWWVDGTFPFYAPLYDQEGEIGHPILLFGRGTARAAALRVDGQTRGWRWGENDGKLSWGKNRVAAVTHFTTRDGGGDFDSGDWMGGGGIGGSNKVKSLGEMLVWGFVDNGDKDTGSVSSGDSGGGVFIKDGSVWKLVGITHGTDAGFRRKLAPGAASEPFRAALFDGRGLYRAADNSLIGAKNSGDDQNVLNRCSLGFACRISSHKAEIDAALSKAPHSRITRRVLAKMAGGTLGALAVLAVGITVVWRRLLKKAPH